MNSVGISPTPKGMPTRHSLFLFADATKLHRKIAAYQQLNPAQLELLLAGVIESVGEPESEPQDEEPDIARRRKRRRHTQRFHTPENLEVVREVIEPELVQAKPAAWK